MLNEPTIESKVENARLTLEFYAKLPGMSEGNAIRDFLTDLEHYCTENDIDFWFELHAADNNYASERAIYALSHALSPEELLTAGLSPFNPIFFGIDDEDKPETSPDETVDWSDMTDEEQMDAMLNIVHKAEPPTKEVPVEDFTSMIDELEQKYHVDLSKLRGANHASKN